MDEKELKELFRELEEQGWEPQLCDTPVPYYENAVMCGNPADVGNVVCGMEMYPKEFFDNQNEFIAIVKGDSMKDANIDEGDKVKVLATKSFQDGDILLVSIDGEYTLKSFCRDEDGSPWLIPQNAAYKAFSIEESQNVRVYGVVTEVIKQRPRIAFRSCIKKIKAARQAAKPQKTITMEQVESAVLRIAPEIKVSRHWYAVFRALVDMNVYKMEDISLFVCLLNRLVPNHEHLTTTDDLQRMAVQSFAKPVPLWDENNAPVPAGKRFMDYKKIAEKTTLYMEES